MATSSNSTELPNSTIVDKNDLTEIINEIVEVLSLDDDENKSEIVNYLLESGRQSLTRYKENITPKIYKEIMIGYDNKLISSLKKYFEKLWEAEYGKSNKWLISFLEHYKTEYTDVYQCVLNRNADCGNIYMKNCPILSIVLQLLFEDIDDDCLKKTTIFDDLWFTITNDGLRSIEKYSEYIVKSVYQQQLKIPSPLFQALCEYFRSSVVLSLKEIKIPERNNLYESILGIVAEYGWLTDLKLIEDDLTPRSLKLLLKKLSSFHQKQKPQENDFRKVTEVCLTTTDLQSTESQSIPEENQDGETMSMSEAIEREREQFAAYVSEKGVSGYAGFLEARLHEWNKYIVRIVLIGSSGQGKSTIINTIRGLDARAAEAAKVGITECTSTVNEYSDPKNSNLIYYDFPGVGTANFPRDKYFENIKKVTKDKIDIQQYDFFLIISADRFTENDVWLAEQLKHKEKPFYFVRTKIDQSLENEKCDYPEDYDENRILQEIRDNCYAEFKKIQVNKINHLDVQDLKVFLISGKLKYSMKWDFPSMMKSLTEDLPTIKRQAIIHSVHNLSKDIIKQKADLLRSNVWRMAMVSGLCGTIPIPFFSVLPDFYIINRYKAHFKATLGLDDESLRTIAQIHGCTFEQLSKHMLSSCTQVLNAASLICNTTEEGLKNVAKEGIKAAAEEGIKTAAEEGIKTAAEESMKTAIEESMKIAATRIVRESGTTIILDSGPRILRESGFEILRESGSGILRESGFEILRESGSGILRESGCIFHRQLASTVARESVATVARESAATIAKESATTIAKESATTIAKESVVTVADFVPVIGAVVGATVNYNSMKYRLNKLIGEMEEVAYRVLAFVKDSSMIKI